jgi:hypothetical protein
MEGGKEQHIYHTAKTYQATGVTFVVKPFTTWILAILIGDKVGAVNAGFDPLIMPKNKFDLLILFDSRSNLFFTVTPPSTRDWLLIIQKEPVHCHQSILVLERWKFVPKIPK